MCYFEAHMHKALSLFFSLALLTSLHADVGSCAAKFFPTSQVPRDTPICELLTPGDDVPSRHAGLRAGMPTDTGRPQWSSAMTFSNRNGQYVAHFKLHTADVIDASGATGMVLYIANETRKAAGMYNLRIAISQDKHGGKVSVFDAQGNKVAGTVPLLDGQPEAGKRDLCLPWRDGMSAYYSVVIQMIESKPCVAVIQHRHDPLPAGRQYQPLLHDLLATYATHPMLQDRPDGFLDDIENMKLLPLPYTSPVYDIKVRGTLHLGLACKVGAMSFASFV